MRAFLSSLAFHLRRLCCCIPLFLDLFASPCHAFEARVVRVIDGDTILVAPMGLTQPEDFTLSIRLYGIDAPELDQEYGQTSQKSLSDKLAQGAKVDIVSFGTDRQRRIVAAVLHRGDAVNFRLLLEGHVWFDPKYCRMEYCGNWKKAQAEAQQNKRGLWSTENPIPPWEWRKRDKTLQ